MVDWLILHRVFFFYQATGTPTAHSIKARLAEIIVTPAICNSCMYVVREEASLHSPHTHIHSSLMLQCCYYKRSAISMHTAPQSTEPKQTQLNPTQSTRPTQPNYFGNTLLPSPPLTHGCVKQRKAEERPRNLTRLIIRNSTPRGIMITIIIGLNSNIYLFI